VRRVARLRLMAAVVRGTTLVERSSNGGGEGRAWRQRRTRQVFSGVFASLDRQRGVWRRGAPFAPRASFAFISNITSFAAWRARAALISNAPPRRAAGIAARAPSRFASVRGCAHPLRKRAASRGRERTGCFARGSSRRDARWMCARAIGACARCHRAPRQRRASPRQRHWRRLDEGVRAASTRAR